MQVAKARRGLWVVILAVLLPLLATTPYLIRGYSGGPPIRRTLAPGEKTCLDAGCHSGTRIESSYDVVLETGASLTYRPGAAQRWVLRNLDRSARAYGFQITSRVASAPESRQAGEFSIDGSTMLQLLCADDRPKGAAGCAPGSEIEYVQHSLPSLTGEFAFTWTPPLANVGPVQVFVASNASVAGQRESRVHLRSFLIQPQAQTTGVAAVNAASYQGTVSPGAWVTLFGPGFAATTRTLQPEDIRNGRLPEELDGVRVIANGEAAPLSLVSPGQINIQVPEIPGQSELVGQVWLSGRVTAEFRAKLETLSPALFTLAADSGRYVAAIHPDGVLVGKPGLLGRGTILRRCSPGEVISLYGTGFGATLPHVPSGVVPASPAALAHPLRLQIGGVDALVRYAGLSGAGLYQFNVVVPPLNPGDHAVAAEINGERSQPGVFLPVAP